MKASNILDPVQPELDGTVWQNPSSPEPQLKPILGRWIHKVVFGALEKAGYTDPQRYCRLVLTGSLCTYQYSPQSDVDVSVFVQSKHLPEWSRAEMIGVLTKDVDGLLLPGTTHPMQMYVVAEGLTEKDLYKKGLRSGYDLGKNRWIVPPDHSLAHDPEKEMGAEYTYALEVADKMERLLTFEPDKAKHYYEVLHKRRRQSEQAGKGDFDRDNLAYKMLSNRGYFDRLRDLGVKIAQMDPNVDEALEQQEQQEQQTPTPAVAPEPYQTTNPFAPGYQFTPSHTCQNCAQPITHLKGETFADANANTTCNLSPHVPAMSSTCKFCKLPIQFEANDPGQPYSGKWLDKDWEDSWCGDSSTSNHEPVVGTEAPKEPQKKPLSQGKIPCKKCDQTGVTKASCEECGGHGDRFDYEAGEYVKCENCGGSGNGPTQACPTCHGQGSIDPPEGSLVCDQCHGTGEYENWVCPFCGGKGYASAFYAKHSPHLTREDGWKRWWGQASGDYRQHLRRYQGSSSGVNSILRDGHEPGRSYYGIPDAEVLDQAMESHPRMEHPTILWRGAPGLAADQIGGEVCPTCNGTGTGPLYTSCPACHGIKFDLSKWPGRTFVDPGFESCSVNRAIAENFGSRLMFKINCPSGTPGIFLPDNGYEEEEWILPRGAHFYIVSVEGQGGEGSIKESPEKPIEQYIDEFQRGQAPNHRLRSSLDKTAKSDMIEVEVNLLGFSPSSGTQRWAEFKNSPSYDNA